MTVVLLLAIAAAQSQSGAPPRDARAVDGAAAIAGRITEQGSGRPLPRMVVTALSADRSRRFDAITDDDGRYELTGLDAGQYTLWAAHDEHRSTYLPQRYGETAPATIPLMGPRPNITLKAGERRAGADIALLRGLAIEGRVSDPWDHPMADVNVVVTRTGGGFPAARPAGSDDRGFYRVYGLAPGRYRVCVDMQGSVHDPSADNARLARTCHPSAVAESEAGEIVLTSGDALGVDIRVQRIRSSSISGFVTDSAGVPVDGGSVGAHSIADVAGGASASTRAGEFVLNGLTPGRYVLRASIGEVPPGEPSPLRREPEVGYASVDVPGGDVTGVTIVLSKGVHVAGRVVFEGTPAPRAPALRMVVQTRPVEDRSGMLGRLPFAPVNDDLSFELKSVYRQPLIVGIHSLPDGWVLKSVRYDGREITYLPTDIAALASTARLEIVLTNRVARPSVRVTDEQTQPLASCYLVVVPADPSHWRSTGPLISETPNSDGELELGAMLPGNYMLAALPMQEAALLVRDPSRIDALASIGTRVTFVEGDRRTFALRLSHLPPAR